VTAGEACASGWKAANPAGFAEVSERILLSIRRVLPPSGAYEAAWAAVRQAAEHTGARAWRFASRTDESLQLEFIEFRLSACEQVRAAIDPPLAALDRMAPGTLEEWIEIPPPTENDEGP
jgi:hypothetical protein